MGFNLWRFLRRASPAGLREYFEWQGIAFTEPVDWAVPANAVPRAVFNAIEALAPADRDEITSDFEQVDKLCNSTGQTALQSVVAADANLLCRLRSAESYEARALAVLLKDRTLFDRALALAYAECLLNGRSWSAFAVRDAASHRANTENLREFERDVAEIFLRLDGSGRRLKIDSFDRPVLGRDGITVHRNTHYCIYAEGLPESHLEFQGGEPRRRTRRLVHEGAVSYDPDRKMVDVIARGGKAVRTEIAQSFARNVLGLRHDVQPVSARRFNLNRLKRPQEFDSDTADGIKSVKVFLLRFASLGKKYDRVTIEIGPTDHTDIYASSAKWFGDADPLRWFEWQVAQAKLQIVFHPEPGSTREKRVTIELRAPNGSNLKEQFRHHQLVSEKYLRRWGLVVETEA